jgi:HrpA-like RNA helicase
MMLNVAELIVVTQPRRVAAESLAKHVAQETKTTLGDLVGFKTAFREEYSANTRILYCTDGIEMLQQLYGINSFENTMFVIDEAHEWNINLEILIAWFKHLLSEGKSLKLVILSATLEADLLAEFFGNAKVINCEGVVHPINDIPHMGGVGGAAVRLLKRGMSVLVFVPGKQEIRETIQRITYSGVKAKCLPFHAEMSAEDIGWVFETFDEPKCVIATTIAQTSLTIADIDAVVDSGLERGQEFRKGVEGLYTRPISLAERALFSTPAIQQHDLSQMVLTILAAGYEPERLAFFHPPTLERINEARRVLINIGLLDINDRLTIMGKKAAQLPLVPRAARILLAGVDEHGVVDYNAITMAILFEGKNLQFRTEEGKNLLLPNYIEAGDSDAFERVKTFDAACHLPTHKLWEYGIESTTFIRLQEERAAVVERLRRLGYTQGRQHMMLHAKYVVAGLSDCVFVRSKVTGDYTSENFGSTPRKLPNHSCVTAEKVVGLPWNFETHSDLGPVVRRLLMWATVVPN